MDLNKLVRDKNGNIKTGEYSVVPANALSQQGYQMALAYAQKNGTTLPSPQNTAQNSATTSNTSTSQPAGTLTDFKSVLDQVTNLAKEKRNALSLEFMRPFQGTSAASDFSGILNNLNDASNTFAQDQLKKIIPDQTQTTIQDVGGRKLLLNSLTGETLKDLGPSDEAYKNSLTGGSAFGNLPSTITATDATGKTSSVNTSLLSDAFNFATTGMPSTQLPQAKNTFVGLLNRGDIDGAKAYVIRTALANAGVDQQNQAIGRYQAIENLNEIKSLLDQAKALGADTNLLSGSLVNVAAKLGVTSNKDLSYIGSRIQQALQVYRRSMTGVAFSPNESKEYAKIFPDITNVDGLNAAKIDSLVDGFDANNRAALGFYIGDTNYEKLYGKAQTPLLPTQKENGKTTNPVIPPGGEDPLDIKSLLPF